MLAIRTNTICPGCQEEPVEITVTQLALLIHGGYGEDKKVTVEVCWCGVREIAVDSVSPRGC